MAVRPIAPDQALKLNAEIPVAVGPNPAAAAFMFKGNAAARAQALNCLASAVYYEAGNQDDDGERAVAQVVLNRVRHPAFPASVCGVVYQGSTRPTGCQFTFTCDGSLYRQPDADGWRRATARSPRRRLPAAVYAPVGWATHYHADYVVPYWASTLAKNAVVGAHLFYRWARRLGSARGLRQGLCRARAECRGAAQRGARRRTSSRRQASSVAAGDQGHSRRRGAEARPSMRGDKRVAVRFNLAARKASDEVEARGLCPRSSRLRTISNGRFRAIPSADNQQPLGKAGAALAARQRQRLRLQPQR